MAITVTQEPTDQKYSIHSHLWHTVTSDNSSLPSFQFIFEVVIAGTVVATYKRYAQGAGMWGTFDAAPTVRDYRQGYWTTTTQFLNDTPFLATNYSIRYGETYFDTATSTQITSLNLLSRDYAGYNCAEGLFTGAFATPLMTLHNALITDRGRQYKGAPVGARLVRVPPGQTAYVPLLWDDISQPLRILCRALNPTGVTSVTATFPGINGPLLQLILRPITVNAAFFGGTSVVSDQTLALEFTIYKGFGTVIDTLRVNYDCTPIFKPVQLHFLNRYGGFDTMSFAAANRAQAEIKPVAFGSTGYALDIDGVNSNRINSTMTNLTFLPTQLNQSTVTENSIKLASQYISEQDKRWLLQLQQSPEIYMEQDGLFYPVLVKNTSWSESLTAADKMINFEVEIILNSTRQQFI